MFKKLKDKIAEEINQSPLAHIAQAVVSPNSSSVFEPSSSNDKFCITEEQEGDIEEDEVKTQGERSGGFTSVALTGQITSPLRDKKMGFRSSSSSFNMEAENLFPTFDSQPTNFHVQSDWESASEVEDRYSQLEHINKESLYEAYRKVYNRYNRVKNKYQELATHYRLLEREKDKAKSVLAETQDKTLMRIGELKEQCQLEQQAKAHLEEALRNELEERDHIIKTLKTKVQYLKAVNEGTVSENLDVKKTQKAEGDNLIDFTENICVSKVPLPSDASNNEESIPSLENQLERYKKFLLEKTSKLEQLEKEVEELKKPKPYEERSSRFDSDDISLDHQKSKEELEMYLCLRNFISELGEEVKAIQENRISHLPLACVNKQVNLQSSVEEDIDDKHVFESTAHMENSTKLSEIEHNLSGYGDATNIPFNSKCLHNIANCDELKELKSQCELLKQKLEEEVVLTKNLKTELNSVNELVCTVRTNLKTSRENYENDNFNFKTSIQTDSDILSDLNFCIDSLYSTRKEFIELENLKVKLEDEVRNIKDKLSLLKSDQAIQTDYDSDKIQHEEEMSISELMDVNDELKQKLEILENEYSNLQDKEVSLSTTVNDLTLENQKLQSKIESLNIALEGMKKDYIVQQMSSEQASLDFDKNASLLKNQISSLEEELKNTNINNSLQLDSKEKNITILKENNCEILQRNSVLQLENDKLKSELEKSNADRKILSEDQEKLLNEMIILRAQHDDLTIENKSVSKQNVEFENTEEMTQHEEISISELMVANEELKQRLESLTKEYDGLLDKEDSLSTTVNDLTLENQKLQSKIESLNISLEGLKKDYIVQQTRLEQASLDFNRNTNLLKDQISSLEEELKNTIINNSVQLDSKEKNITILKENNSELLERNNVLQVENNKLKSELEESNRDREILIEEKDKLLNEMISLKMQNDELTSENKSICEKVVELENYNKKACNDLLVAADEKEKSLHELSLLKQNYDTVNSEKIILTGKVSNLENDAEKMKNDLALILEEKEKLLCDTSLSRKECDNIITEKNMLDEKINKLENQCEKTSIELELSLKKVTQLTEEMSSLRKNHKELIEENKNLHNTIDRVKKELESNKSKYLSTSEEKNKMSDEMQLLKKEQESLIIIKDTLQSKILSLEDELNGTKKEILSSTENKNKLNNTIQELKKECEIKTVKMSEIQKNFDNLLPRYEKLQKEITELTEAKLKLHDELDILKKEYSDTFQTLNVTKKQLEDQLTYSADLDKKLSACSETLKRKCNDVEEKCLENASLRTDLEDLLIKLNNKSSVVECLAKDKELLINNLLLRVDSMKNIKNLQQNIAVFIQQFRAEMIKELNDVKYKVQNELMHHININLENEACTKKIAEAENKSKQDIDSYKRKINYLLIELQNLIDMSNSQLSDKDNSLDSVDRVRHCVNSNNNVMEQCNGSEENSSPESLDTKLCELRRNILFHQNRCDSLEIEINKAVNIIKSTRRVLKAILEDKILSPIVKLDGDGMEVDETITKKIQEDVLGMELFLKSHESKKSYNNNNAPHNADFPNGVFITVEDTLQNINSLTVDKECKKMEVGQLRQEIRIKDDMINKLQQVILGRAEEGEIALIDKSTLTFTQPTVTDNEKINERQLVLEHKNKSLLEKLQNIQEKYELNIKSLITKYEQKIEEKEKQIKTSEFEILGAEKRHIVNEMKEQIENLQQDLDERGDAFEKLYEEHQQSVKSKEGEIQQLRSNYEKEMREQDKKWRSCLDRRLAEEEARHQEETAELTRQWTNQKKELETTSRLAVKAVESGSNSSDMMRRQVQALTLQLTELQSHRCETCDHQRAIASKRLRSITSKYSQDCTEMEYLRNILYEYMMGKEPMVLARVLCALMKFDENQTRDIVLKEKQKVTVFGQLGIL